MKTKKILASILAVASVLTMTACNSNSETPANTGDSANTGNSANTNSDNAADTQGESNEPAKDYTKFQAIVDDVNSKWANVRDKNEKLAAYLAEDHSGDTGSGTVNAHVDPIDTSNIPTGLTLSVLSHRTDLNKEGNYYLNEMTDAFEEKYGCTVEYTTTTKYASDVGTRMSTNDYGDVLMIPNSVKIQDLGNYFVPLGTVDELSQKYNWIDKKSYEGIVYGIPHVGNVSGGIVYNKRVWKEAGITELPKTPEEFIADLKQIKENCPDVIPYYTNFAASDWTLDQWVALVGSAYGDPDYKNNILINKEDPLKQDGGYYKVFKLIYDVFSEPSILEEDPNSSDWEASKPWLAEGKIATMTMGSWAVSQCQEFAVQNGQDPADVGFMPAPFTVDGVQYGETAADYAMGINKNIDEDHIKLAMAYITWFVEESPYTEHEIGIPTLKGGSFPSFMEGAWNDCILIEEAPAPDGLEGVFDEIDKEAEINFWGGEAGNFKIRIGEAALTA
ncbi:MAG: extracellular solute-binding protein [Firmicutes bacterium]|nr:extracellular solute-binding protein [[Eubacterium] siraeum]MCM1487971.1 extracellular solute-binding protein [Bacillota bacterium]